MEICEIVIDFAASGIYLVVVGDTVIKVVAKY